MILPLDDYGTSLSLDLGRIRAQYSFHRQHGYIQGSKIPNSMEARGIAPKQGSLGTAAANVLVESGTAATSASVGADRSCAS